MKHLITLSLLLLSITGKSQEIFSNYSSDYFGKKYDISIGTQDKKGVFRFYIDCESMDNTSKKASMILASEDVPEFVVFVDSLHKVYTKWVKTAKDNNVTELSKELPLKFSKIEAAFAYGKWQFDNTVRLTPRFKIVNGKYLLIVESGELQSISNQFMKSKGLYIVFNSDTEFDALINSIDIKKAGEFVRSKSKKEELFN